MMSGSLTGKLLIGYHPSPLNTFTSTVMEQQHQFRSLATADPSLVAQTSSFLAAARAESDKNAKKPKTSGFMKPKDDE